MIGPSSHLQQLVGAERHVSALKLPQLAISTQLVDDSLQVLLATALLALAPLPKIAIRRLSVAWSSGHVLTPRC